MSEESDIAKGFADFYQRALLRLSPVPSTKPFEVRVDTQQLKSTSFGPLANELKLVEEDQPTLGVPPPIITSIVPNSGTVQGGLRVEVNGQNFIQGATITFGGTLGVDISFINSTKLVCLTPPHSGGLVDITVTNLSDSRTATLHQGFDYFYPSPDSYFWYSSGPPLTPWGFLYGEIKTLFIQAFYHGQPYNTYQGQVNVSTETIGPNVSFNDNPDINFPINVINGVAVLQIQPFCNISGSTVQSLQFMARDVQYPSVQGDTVLMGVASGSGSVGRKTGGGGGGGADHFVWADASIHAFGWGPDESQHSLTILRKTVGGFLNIAYNGTAAITVQILTQIPPVNGRGVSVSIAHTVTFASGRASLSASASFDYHDVADSQGYGYFNLICTDGPISSLVQCAALNHL